MRHLDHPDWLLTRVELAGILGCSDRTVTTLTQKGMPQHSRGRWHVGEVLRWRHDGGRVRDPAEPSAYTEAKTALANARREKVEAITADLRKQLVPTDEVLWLFREFEAIFSRGLAELPAVASDGLAGCDAPEIIEQLLEDATLTARARIAADVQKLAEKYP